MPNYSGRITLDTVRSLANELSCHAKAFAISKEPWHLEEMKRILVEADPGLKDAPPPENVYLHKFVDPAVTSWSDIDSQHFIDEMETLWADLVLGKIGNKDIDNVEIISPGRVTSIKKCITDSRAFVEYHILPYFISQACFDLCFCGTSRIEDIVFMALARFNYSMGLRESMPAVPPLL